MPQQQERSWRAIGGEEASSNLQASMYHKERSRLQVSHAALLLPCPNTLLTAIPVGTPQEAIAD